MVASHYGHTEVVRELAKRGADFNLSTVRMIHFRTMLNYILMIHHMIMPSDILLIFML